MPLSTASAFLCKVGEFDADIIRQYHFQNLHAAGRLQQYNIRHPGQIILDLVRLQELHGHTSATLTDLYLYRAAINAYLERPACPRCQIGVCRPYVCLECNGAGCSTCKPHHGFAGVWQCTNCECLNFDEQ